MRRRQSSASLFGFSSPIDRPTRLVFARPIENDLANQHASVLLRLAIEVQSIERGQERVIGDRQVTDIGIGPEQAKDRVRRGRSEPHLRESYKGSIIDQGLQPLPGDAVDIDGDRSRARRVARSGASAAPTRTRTGRSMRRNCWARGNRDGVLTAPEYATTAPPPPKHSSCSCRRETQVADNGDD